MFRATMCLSSGKLTVSMLIFILYEWLSGLLVGMRSHPKFHLMTHITPQIAHVAADSSTLDAMPISSESGLTHFTSANCS